MFSSHPFTVYMNDNVYEFTKGFSYARDLENMASAFEISLTDPDDYLIKEFRPGYYCEIEINNVIISKGYIDKYSMDDSEGHIFTYIGRDRVGDLIDCSARFSNGGFERRNISLKDAIKDVLKPYDITVTVDTDIGKNFPKLAINPGDTVFQFIDQICKYRAVFPLSDGVGGLILTNLKNIKSPGNILFGEDGNVKSRSAIADHTERYSEIVVMGQADAGDFGEADSKILSGSKGTAIDKDITRHRPLIIQAEREGYDLDMQERAEWEVRHRRFKGIAIDYILSGWEATPNKIWTIGSIVPVKDSKLLIDREMIIKSFNLGHDNEGTISQVTVAPSEAYDIPPIRQPKDDDTIWGGGE